MPAKMDGMALGSSTRRMICCGLAPRSRAASTRPGSHWLTPKTVLITIGKIAPRKLIVSMKGPPVPSQMISSGMRVIFGSGYSAAINISATARARNEVAIQSPRIVPQASAMAKPANMRQSVTPRSIARPPLPNSATSATTICDGRGR